MSTFGYTNARIRAWKSNLLDNTFMEKLLSAKDSEAVGAMLSRTIYQKDIENGVIKQKGISGIEEGLQQNLTKIFQKLLIISANDNKAQHLIEIILSRWDIYNLKTILRGFHAEANEDEIYEQLIPVGVFDETTLRTLVGQPNMKMVISQLILFAPEYATPLLNGYKQYEKTNNLSKLELDLDKAYFASVLSRTAKKSESIRIINKIIRREIDFINIMALLKLHQVALPDTANPNDYFLDNGSITVEKLSEYVKINDVKELIEVLRRTEYYEHLRTGYIAYQKTGSLASIERVIEDYNVQKNVSLFRADPLSVATIVAFVWAKINEIINLRIILRGKQVEMPSEDIKEALVLV